MMNAEKRSSASNRQSVPKQGSRQISLESIQRELYQSDICRELPKGTKGIRILSDEVRFRQPPKTNWNTVLEYTVPPFIFRRSDVDHLPVWHIDRLVPYVFVVTRRARTQRVVIPYETAKKMEEHLGVPVDRPPVFENFVKSPLELELSYGRRQKTRKLE